MSDLPAVPPKPKRRFSEKKFVNALVVRTANGQRLSVPTDQQANKARTQIIAARTTELFTKQIELYSRDGVTLEPKELREFIAAGKLLQELNEAAHGNGPMPDAGVNPLTGLGQLVQGAVMAGAAAAQGTQSNLAEQMKKLTELGKAADKERRGKEIVVVEESAP